MMLTLPVLLLLAAGTPAYSGKPNEEAAIAAETSLPAGAKRIAVDSEAGLVWVLVGSHTLLRIQDQGDKLETRTIDGLADKTLAFPRLLSVSAGGRLYLTDAASNYIASDVEGRTFRRLAWYGAGGHGYCATDSEGNWYVSARLDGRARVDQLHDLPA